jgi:tetratricopeptide (TPR) repeat protein
MPLLSISSEDAFLNTKQNAQNTWPKRDQADNRVEPLTKPHFAPTFALVPKESVFTIGSCFARNVEGQLEAMGFEVPMRHLKVVEDAPDDPENNPNIFNNYAVPSILNELEWAIDPETPFDAETCLLEVGRGLYCDLHLTRLLKAVSKEVAIARRGRIKDGFAKVKDCRVIIITLGLVEAWWDKEAKRYLNIAPPKQAAKRYPDRFELHVMSYAEVMHYLERIVALLKKHGHPEHRIVLTVSPVPLGVTFTDQDVITANTYSKSVLRAAAQEIWLKYDHVDYFPSYESIVHSDRARAWHDDLRHPTTEVIKLNVGRMVAAYSGEGAVHHDGQDLSHSLMEAQSAEKAREVSEAAMLYQEILAADPTLKAAQLGLGRCLGLLRQPEEAEALLSPLLTDQEVRREALIALSRVYRFNNMGENFERMVDGLAVPDDMNLLRELIITCYAFSNVDKVIEYCEVMRERWPRSPVSFEYMARINIDRENWDVALVWLQDGVKINQNSPAIYALLGDLQMKLGNADDANDSFARAKALNGRSGSGVPGAPPRSAGAVGAHQSE